MTKIYLCDEFGQRFYLKATSPGQARQDAAIYGAQVIAGPLDKKFEKIDPKTLVVKGGKVIQK